MTPRRVFTVLWLVGCGAVAVLLLAAPSNARFGAAVMGLIFAGYGLALATNARGAAADASRTVMQKGRLPQGLATTRAARIWGAVCLLVGCGSAAQALLDKSF